MKPGYRDCIGHVCSPQSDAKLERRPLLCNNLRWPFPYEALRQCHIFLSAPISWFIDIRLFNIHGIITVCKGVIMPWDSRLTIDLEQLYCYPCSNVTITNVYHYVFHALDGAAPNKYNDPRPCLMDGPCGCSSLGVLLSSRDFSRFWKPDPSITLWSSNVHLPYRSYYNTNCYQLEYKIWYGNVWNDMDGLDRSVLYVSKARVQRSSRSLLWTICNTKEHLYDPCYGDTDPGIQLFSVQFHKRIRGMQRAAGFLSMWILPCM